MLVSRLENENTVKQGRWSLFHLEPSTAVMPDYREESYILRSSCQCDMSNMYISVCHRWSCIGL